MSNPTRTPQAQPFRPSNPPLTTLCLLPSFGRYSTELKHALGIKDGRLSATGASDLQAQHQEMANILKRERLSASLAKRPSLDALQQRNILPDAQRVSLSRERLASSFALRPPAETLLEQHILHPSDEKAEQLAKRKRLEGFLEKRPTLEQVQARTSLSEAIPIGGGVRVPNGRQSLDATLSLRLGQQLGPALDAAIAGAPPPAIDSSLPTLDAALGGDSQRDDSIRDEMES